MLPAVGVDGGDGAGLAVAEVGVGVPVVSDDDPVAGLELESPPVGEGGSGEPSGGGHVGAGELVEHPDFVVAGGEHPDLVDAVGLGVGPPGVDHGGLGGVLVAAEVEASGFVVVVDGGSDVAGSEALEDGAVEVEWSGGGWCRRGR